MPQSRERREQLTFVSAPDVASVLRTEDDVYREKTHVLSSRLRKKQKRPWDVSPFVSPSYFLSVVISRLTRTLGRKINNKKKGLRALRPLSFLFWFKRKGLVASLSLKPEYGREEEQVEQEEEEGGVKGAGRIE